MKKIIALLAICLTWSSLASAEIKIGVVDVRGALLSTSAAKKFGEEMQNEFKDEVTRQRDLAAEVRRLQDRLKKDAAILSEAERRKLGEEVNAKAQEFAFLQNRLENMMKSREAQFFQDSKPGFDAALEQVAKTEKLDLILPREVILYGGQAIDYTAKVIDILNKK